MDQYCVKPTTSECGIIRWPFERTNERTNGGIYMSLIRISHTNAKNRDQWEVVSLAGNESGQWYSLADQGGCRQGSGENGCTGGAGTVSTCGGLIIDVPEQNNNEALVSIQT